MKNLTLALMTNARTFSLCSFFEPGFHRSMGSPPGSIETAGGGSGSGSGQTSLLAALAAERDAAMEREAAEAAAAERVAREFRGLFSNIPSVRGARDRCGSHSLSVEHHRSLRRTNTGTFRNTTESLKLRPMFLPVGFALHTIGK